MDLLRNWSWHLANETYCWLNAKHNTSVRIVRQAEPQQHTENAKEWDLQTGTLPSIGSQQLRGVYSDNAAKKTKGTLWQLYSQQNVYALTPVVMSSGHTIKRIVAHIPEVLYFNIIIVGFELHLCFSFFTWISNILQTSVA